MCFYSAWFELSAISIMGRGMSWQLLVWSTTFSTANISRKIDQLHLKKFQTSFQLLCILLVMSFLLINNNIVEWISCFTPSSFSSWQVWDLLLFIWPSWLSWLQHRQGSTPWLFRIYEDCIPCCFSPALLF